LGRQSTGTWTCFALSTQTTQLTLTFNVPNTVLADVLSWSRTQVADPANTGVSGNPLKGLGQAFQSTAATHALQTAVNVMKYLDNTALLKGLPAPGVVAAIDRMRNSQTIAAPQATIASGQAALNSALGSIVQ
jgi:hypothetical protein